MGRARIRGRKLAAVLRRQLREFLGIAASAPSQKPDVSGLAVTTIRVYNGAETSAPLTVAALEGLFGIKAQLLTDPAATADIAVITGAGTPSLTPPPIP